tara:strand:+ start:169 stop:354 length:186 start_codon:yes stop_codon:yes gene_type:complete
MKGNDMEIFTPLKILLVVLTTFIVMLLAKEYAKGDTSSGRIKQYREFCIDNSTNKQLPCYF